MENENVHKVNKKKKKGKSSKLISFDEEVVPKHVAQQILAKENASNNETESKKKTKKVKKVDQEVDHNRENGSEPFDNDVTGENSHVNRKRKKKKKSATNNGIDEEVHVSNENESDNQHTTENDNNDTTEEHSSKKKKKKKKREQEISENTEQENEDEVQKPKKKRKIQNSDEAECSTDMVEENTNEPSESKKKESIRAQKRKKYAQLLQDKKLQAELGLQQKSLNYLSKWKHSRSEWKFEKLRQIWLQQSMYDSSKVPQEFWETLVEYFSHSKGKVRDSILKDAVKIIEAENSEEETQVKVERARDIIQNLQE
ncbi:hypothetical protein Zmor_010401 [Zophobas morio]|uniref:WKF domain-containing protein n=1 Tax=Zophobas morio TaxID=2755281 RepID=A0AA38IRU2_9CUCU|nr:hypothetical protein Zmor_010401 [Zophobas morio]